jgi:hypothetical protein
MEDALSSFTGPRDPSARDYVHVLLEGEEWGVYDPDDPLDPLVRYVTIFREDGPALNTALTAYAMELYLGRWDVDADRAHDWVERASLPTYLVGGRRWMINMVNGSTVEITGEATEPGPFDPDDPEWRAIHTPFRSSLGQANSVTAAQISRFLDWASTRMINEYTGRITRESLPLPDQEDQVAELAVLRSDHDQEPRPLPEAYDPRPEPKNARDADDFDDFLKRTAAIIEECSR